MDGGLRALAALANGRAVAISLGRKGSLLTHDTGESMEGATSEAVGGAWTGRAGQRWTCELTRESSGKASRTTRRGARLGAPAVSVSQRLRLLRLRRSERGETLDPHNPCRGLH